MIGVGKSSVAEALAEHLGTEIFHESVDDNEVIGPFYTASPEEQEKYRFSFLLQLEFLNSRFRDIKQAMKDDNNVLDRSIYEDWYFAKINTELNRIRPLEFKIYEKLLHNMMEEIEGTPKKAPDLMIYLHASFERIMERIGIRGRDFEQGSELVDYYRKLWEGYDDWIDNHYDASQVIKINMDKYDIVNDEEDREIVLGKITDKLKEMGRL